MGSGPNGERTRWTHAVHRGLKSGSRNAKARFRFRRSGLWPSGPSDLRTESGFEDVCRDRVVTVLDAVLLVDDRALPRLVDLRLAHHLHKLSRGAEGRSWGRGMGGMGGVR